MWAMIDSCPERNTYEYYLIRTGETIPVLADKNKRLNYLGTCQEEFMVWHLFEVYKTV
jgi:hypothetical protein